MLCTCSLCCFCPQCHSFAAGWDVWQAGPSEGCWLCLTAGLPYKMGTNVTEDEPCLTMASPRPSWQADRDGSSAESCANSVSNTWVQALVVGEAQEGRAVSWVLLSMGELPQGKELAGCATKLVHAKPWPSCCSRTGKVNGAGRGTRSWTLWTPTRWSYTSN